MVENIVEKIKAADLVLIGIGEELDAFRIVEKEKQYQEFAARIDKPERVWILPFLKKELLKNVEKEKILIYESLANILKQKNYFVVSLCEDGLVERSGLDKNRIVEPCGGYDKLQCSSKCSAELYSVPEGLFDQIVGFWDRKGESEPKEPSCPKCGSALVFNNINAADYLEAGYMEGWQRYKKWLQGTVNKSLCVLELGVGMKYPTVIRWPFEKIVFFNQKAEMFRVHERLYQVAEEIKDRAHGICQKPDEFLMKFYAK